MYQMIFKTVLDGRIFTITSSNQPIPRIGEKVSYCNDHYIVDNVKHRFHNIEGPESTGIMITLSLDPDMVFPAHRPKPNKNAAKVPVEMV